MQKNILPSCANLFWCKGHYSWNLLYYWHLLEVTWTLLFQMQVPKKFWSEAVLASTYLINHMPTIVLRGSTLISFLPHTNEHHTLWVFRCTCFIHDLGSQAQKLDVRTVKGTFLGYSLTQKQYKCFIPSSGKWYIMKYVAFMKENSYYSRNTPKGKCRTADNDEKYSRSRNQVHEFIKYHISKKVR